MNSLSCDIFSWDGLLVDLIFCSGSRFTDHVLSSQFQNQRSEKAREICTRGLVRFVFSSQTVLIPCWPHQAQVCNHYFISLLDSISGKKHKNHSSVFMVNNLVLFFPRFSPARLPTLTKLTCEKPTRRKMQTACLVTLKDRRMLNEPILCVFHFFRLKIFSVFCQCSVVGQFKTFGCF